MFGWLKKKPAEVEQASSESRPKEITLQEIIPDRHRMADWVESVLIDRFPWQNNLELLPSDSAQQSLEITFAQKERFAKEHQVLMIAGVLMYMRQHYDDGKYEAFLNDVASRLARALDLSVSQLGDALTAYVRSSLAANAEEIEMTYMRRVYDDSSHFLQMLASGVGSTAVDQITSTYELLRDAVDGKLEN